METPFGTVDIPEVTEVGVRISSTGFATDFFRELWQNRDGKKVRQCCTIFRDALKGLCGSMPH